jgi:hypothetical protein
MSRLADLQKKMLNDILHGEASTQHDAVHGPLGAEDALAIHRLSIFGTLAGALRMVYTTVERITGKEFFDQMANAYARHHPPKKPILTGYVLHFPEFVATYHPAHKYPYLLDVSFFDRSLDECARQFEDVPKITVAIDEEHQIELPQSLQCLNLKYPVDHIKNHLEAGDISTLPGVDMMPNLKSYAVWRGTCGANVTPLTRQAATFINAILNHLSCEEALTLALRKIESVDPLHFITHEVITEPFAKVVVKRCDKKSS